jgi:hypothetical protein
MKKFDYFCMLYIAALLAFGFDNSGSAQGTSFSRIESSNRYRVYSRNQVAIAAHVTVAGGIHKRQLSTLSASMNGNPKSDQNPPLATVKEMDSDGFPCMEIGHNSVAIKNSNNLENR